MAINIWKWYEENRDQFSPPICNKLMHKGQLTVMFVGGPNTRTDFHIEQGSEFFYMLKGNMELPTIQCGEVVKVPIKEGEVFLLPPRIPHSPQRPEENSLGLVVERSRGKGVVSELECLRWFTDESCKETLYEEYFYCNDLGKDLVPVVQRYKKSQECTTKIPTKTFLDRDRPFLAEKSVSVPSPFAMKDFIASNQEAIAQGVQVDLFPDHEMPSANICLLGGENTFSLSSCKGMETLVIQLKGKSTITVDNKDVELIEMSSFIVEVDKDIMISSIGEAVLLKVQIETYKAKA